MQIKLYQVHDDKNVLTKSLGTSVDVIGTIKDESNVVNPEIIMSNTVPTEFNYFYIQPFHRFYYVTDKTVEHGRTIVYGHVDVLMSFNASIKGLNVIADRASNGFNLFLNDPEVPMQNYKIVSVQNFPVGFSSEGLLLATFGN